MSDWSGQPADEVYGSIEELLSWDGMNSGKVQLRCPWDQRFTVAADVVNRLWPHGTLGALAGKIGIKPELGQAAPDAGQKFAYDFAILTVQYDVATLGGIDVVEGGSHDGQLYSESLEPTIEYQKLDHHMFTWTNVSGRELYENEAPSRAMRGMSLVRTLYNLTAIPASILTLPGKTNEAEYVSAALGVTFPEETLLFAPQPARRVVLASGSKGWTLTIKFAYKEQSWNKFWRQDKSGTDKYDEVFDTVNGVVYKNFPPADMSDWLY